MTCVKEAGTVVEIPANIWNSGLKETYGESIISYLKGKSSIEDVNKTLSEF